MSGRDKPTDAQLIKLLELLNNDHTLLTSPVTKENFVKFNNMVLTLNEVIKGKIRTLSQWIQVCLKFIKIH